MRMPEHISEALLAPCGVNCIGCNAHLKVKKPCQGCNSDASLMRKSCQNCARRICAADKGVRWCFQCDAFPCNAMKTLDKTYRTRYGIHLVERGRLAKEGGVEVILEQDRGRLTCPDCGGVVCQIDAICSECGAIKEILPQ